MQRERSVIAEAIQRAPARNGADEMPVLPLIEKRARLLPRPRRGEKPDAVLVDFDFPRHIAVEYHRPARLDDQIAVHSVLTGLSGARINVVQKISCGQTLLVEGRIEACMITLTGKLRRLPQNVLETLAPYVTAEET